MKVTSCLYCGAKQLEYVTHRIDDNGILRCGHCGLMMVENLSDDTEQLYTAEYFEKAEGSKHGYTDYLSSPVANFIGKYGFTRLFAKEPGDHLDLGCADGSMMEIFVSEGFRSHGLEISKDAVAIAKDKGLDVRFSKLDAFPKQLPKSDVITAFDLLEHVANPGTVLKDVYANLSDNGYFVFSTLCVTHEDPTDYWFNNSLEHYAYYNQQNLTYILSEIFGADRFAFAEIEINGVSEFWGFAKKGRLSHEASIIQQIDSGGFNKQNPEDGYLLSLFYNQLSKFVDSQKIIEHFQKSWSADRSVQARFYNNYFQGKFEAALEASKESRHLLPAHNSVYWQALSSAETKFFDLKQQDIIYEYNQEVIGLREQVFKLRDELHALKNSRVLGRVIKLRDAVGTSRHHVAAAPRRAKSLARGGVHKVRVVVAPMVPASARHFTKRGYRATRRAMSGANRQPPKRIEIVSNEAWQKSAPLVSVVITYYNLGETIGETIKSLNEQTFRNFEIIIIDDNSNDPDSIQKLKDLTSSGLEAKLIVHKENQGPAAGRNDGIRAAKGKYIICLDGDDMLEPTFIEKATTVLETAPDTSLITTHRNDFGVFNKLWRNAPYDPLQLIKNNMVINGAQFTKEGWSATRGYTSGIGYEDWEFWLTLAEHGFWGKLIPEALFNYRISMQSRFVGDKDVHWKNLKNIRSLHPDYKKHVSELLAKRRDVRHAVEPDSAFVNLSDIASYSQPEPGRSSNILITVPWMTFGGAETLIYNYCREIKEKFNISFVTGLPSEHEWEYKFREITPHIYHLANMFEDEELRVEFLSNYIKTRQIDILNVIHNGFTFAMLPELKKRHPNLKVVVTLFNDRVEYFEQSVDAQKYIDGFVTDNEAVAEHFRQEVGGKPVTVIPNGIDCYDVFSPTLFDREEERAALRLAEDDLAVFFVGRLSEEKNPDVFLDVAKKLVVTKKLKQLKFFIIGDGPMRPVTDKMIKDIHSDNIVYLGYKPTAEVAKFLSAADVFVLPSSIEGFPLSILEAMAMELAVVASRVGAVPDVIDSGQNGFVVTAGSAKEIADTVEMLGKDRKKLAAIKAKAREKIEKKYSNRILGKNYIKMYREAVK